MGGRSQARFGRSFCFHFHFISLSEIIECHHHGDDHGDDHGRFIGGRKKSGSGGQQSRCGRPPASARCFHSLPTTRKFQQFKLISNRLHNYARGQTSVRPDTQTCRSCLNLVSRPNPRSSWQSSEIRQPREQ